MYSWVQGHVWYERACTCISVRLSISLAPVERERGRDCAEGRLAAGLPVSS